jgi:predicted Rossmann fold nucleotide-binding protein DprA/Smf involved in DNA uptake
MTKRANPTLLHPFFDLHIGNHTYSGIGNRQLLAAQHRVAVRISRRITGQQLDAEIAHYLQLAHNGTVLISPAISPGEKAVMRAAFNAGLPTIVIMANGFTPMSKPHGEQFYACAEGRLLMLSAWEHHNERQKLTANQCQQMNLMALELCNTSIASIKQ